MRLALYAMNGARGIVEQRSLTRIRDRVLSMNGAPTTAGEGPATHLRPLASYCLERDTLQRSLKTALVVGSILALINHGQQFLSGQFSASWIIPMLVTYLVPFSVATYGQVQAKRQRDLLHASPPLTPHHISKNIDESYSPALADLDTVPMRTPSSYQGVHPYFSLPQVSHGSGHHTLASHVPSS